MLIDADSRSWKAELVNNTFLMEDASCILRIPLAMNGPDDMLVWHEEHLEVYSVRSAYKLLQLMQRDPTAYTLQTIYKKFYKLLWSQKLPFKILITVWKLSWNYIPHLVNLQYHRLVTATCSPRCTQAAESIDHIFRACRISRVTWLVLNLSHLFNNTAYLGF